MVITKVLKKEEGENPKEYVISFNFFGNIKTSVITENVLRYNHISSIDVGDEILVSKLFNAKEMPVYLVRKVILKNGKKPERIKW